ncbi:325_t:CDS:2 [Racocetra persica]|uniref:325_t:CDS:1 n=1 Tax=Racocetra persica TaxID=160502 RepID=A0ACA9M3H8_9GLOM|nr:325_t:CDS:2 [Racocetra persica]
MFGAFVRGLLFSGIGGSAVSSLADENYALKDEIIELDVSKKGLENSLNLNDFVKLRVLKCGNNKLTGLNVSGLVKLEVIECSNNLLTSESLRLSGLSRLETFLGKHNLFENLDFFKSPENLRHLDLTDNNFHKRETTLEKESVGLDIFSNFVNLESLKIGNYSRETKNGKYNRFCGSLEHLSELKNLKKLDIN